MARQTLVAYFGAREMSFCLARLARLKGGGQGNIRIIEPEYIDNA